MQYLPRRLGEQGLLTVSAGEQTPQLGEIDAVGDDVAFGRAAAAIRIAERPVIVLADGDEVSCDFVLGCDGFHGVSRLALEAASCSGVDFGAELSCLSDEWIRDTLTRRLAADDVELIPGRILERGSFELHSYVTEPMQHGPVLLAGDAAHIVTPAGGKGMNLALQDVDELVAGLLEHYQAGGDRRLDAYSATRLHAVWHAVELSHWMLDLLLARPTEGRFREGLRDTRLERLMSGGPFARRIRD